MCFRKSLASHVTRSQAGQEGSRTWPGSSSEGLRAQRRGWCRAGEMGGSGTWRETGLGPPPKDRQSGRRGGRGEQGRGAGRGWPVPPAAPAAAPLVAGPLPRSQTFVVVPGPPHAVPSGALPREPVALTVCGHWLPTPPGSSGPGSTSGTAVGTSSTGQARGAAPPAPGGLGGWASAHPAGGRGARARRRAGRSRGGADGHVEAVCTWLQTVRTRVSS